MRKNRLIWRRTEIKREHNQKFQQGKKESQLQGLKALATSTPLRTGKAEDLRAVLRIVQKPSPESSPEQQSQVGTIYGQSSGEENNISIKEEIS